MSKVLILNAACAAAAAATGTVTPALAECVGQANEFPAYSAVAHTAETVIIGTVVETQRDPEVPSMVFRLRVDEELRGDPPATMEVSVLRSGLPRRGEPGCRRDAALCVMWATSSP